MSEQRFSVEEVDGVGTTTARKLASIGITSVYDLAASLPLHLIEDLKCEKSTAQRYIDNARQFLVDKDLISKEYKNARQILEERQKLLRLATGSSALNELLKPYGVSRGGIESGSITEFYGEFGSGKSQICHTAVAMCSQSVEAGGFGAGCIVLDTEGTFRPERLQQIAQLRGFDVDKVLESTFSAKIYGSAMLEVMVKQLGRYIDQYHAKLVIVDSIASLHRAEYVGRGMLADRQQRLKVIMQKLLTIAEIYNVAVIITNQVSTNPDQSFFAGDPTRPVGGNVIGHSSTYRLYLRKAGENRIAKMVDSPCHPYRETKFTVTDKGVEDVEEEEK